MYDIITIGDATADIFIKTEEISLLKERFLCLGYGDKINIDTVDYEIGGGAVNTAVGFKRLGFNTGLRTMIGKDYFGQNILDQLGKENLDQSLVIHNPKIKTSFGFILTFGRDRSILVYRGILDYGKLKLPKRIKAKWIFLAPLHNNFEALQDSLIPHVSERGTNLILNPGAGQIKGNKRELKKIISIAKILIVNKEEALKIIESPGKISAEKLAEELVKLGVKVAVVTQGNEGAVCADEKIKIQKEAIGGLAKEATGAGDGFSVGFAGRLMLEKEWSREVLSEALDWGLVNSASVIKYTGAQRGLLTRAKING